MRRSWWLTVVVGLLVLASVWYVLAPPRTVGDYRERAGMTAELLRSQVESARLWVVAVEDARVPRQAATVGLREAEEDAVDVASAFAAWDPPARGRELRAQLIEAAGEVTGSLAELRLAAEDERWDELPTLAEPLPRLSDRLDGLARAANP